MKHHFILEWKDTQYFHANNISSQYAFRGSGSESWFDYLVIRQSQSYRRTLYLYIMQNDSIVTTHQSEGMETGESLKFPYPDLG